MPLYPGKFAYLQATRRRSTGSAPSATSRSRRSNGIGVAGYTVPVRADARWLCTRSRLVDVPRSPRSYVREGIAYVRCACRNASSRSRKRATPPPATSARSAPAPSISSRRLSPAASPRRSRSSGLLRRRSSEDAKEAPLCRRRPNQMRKDGLEAVRSIRTSDAAPGGRAKVGSRSIASSRPLSTTWTALVAARQHAALCRLRHRPPRGAPRSALPTRSCAVQNRAAGVAVPSRRPGDRAASRSASRSSASHASRSRTGCRRARAPGRAAPTRPRRCARRPCTRRVRRRRRATRRSGGRRPSRRRHNSTARSSAEHVNGAARVRLEVVPLVGSQPFRREPRRRPVSRIGDIEHCGLNRQVVS